MSNNTLFKTEQTTRSVLACKASFATAKRLRTKNRLCESRQLSFHQKKFTVQNRFGKVCVVFPAQLLAFLRSLSPTALLWVTE